MGQTSHLTIIGSDNCEANLCEDLQVKNIPELVINYVKVAFDGTEFMAFVKNCVLSCFCSLVMKPTFGCFMHVSVLSRLTKMLYSVSWMGRCAVEERCFNYGLLANDHYLNEVDKTAQKAPELIAQGTSVCTPHYPTGNC